MVVTFCLGRSFGNIALRNNKLKIT